MDSLEHVKREMLTEADARNKALRRTRQKPVTGNTSRRIGMLPARYSFLMNPHATVRLSKCPKCRRLTHFRKFALFIHVEGRGPLALGKTCRFCARCDLIMMHQDEFEAQLAPAADRLTPSVVRNEYVVLGTIEKKVWQAGLSRGQPLCEMLKHVAAFQKRYRLEAEPGGWRPADRGPGR